MATIIDCSSTDNSSLDNSSLEIILNKIINHSVFNKYFINNNEYEKIMNCLYFTIIRNEYIIMKKIIDLINSAQYDITKVNINIKSRSVFPEFNDKTPLMLSIFHSFNSLNYILRASLLIPIDINITDQHGNNILFYAIMKKNVGLINLLLEKFNADINYKNFNNEDALIIAFKYNHISKYRQKIKSKYKPKYKPKNIINFILEHPKFNIGSEDYYKTHNIIFKISSQKYLDSNDNLQFFYARKIKHIN